MNQEETLTLYERGKDAWNAWAMEMLAKKTALQQADIWQISGEWDRQRGGHVEIGANEETRAWLDKAKADFSSLRIALQKSQGGRGELNINAIGTEKPRVISCNTERVGFASLIFPGEADFRDTEFCCNTRFSSARFRGPAWFGGAHFCNVVSFGAAEFSVDVSFIQSRFSKDVNLRAVRILGEGRFEKTQFNENADFSYATFSGLRTTFQGSEFNGGALFQAINVDRAFDFGGASFSSVPNFIQAHFSEAPRLDDLKLTRSVEGIRFWHSILRPSTTEINARYRALRRLAVQGHDYDNERLFLKGEIRSRRHTLDKVWYAAYWLGICYDVLSDFGISIARPVLWGAASIVGFAALYYLLVFSDASLCNPDYVSRLWQAAHTSLKNGVLLVSWDSSTDLKTASQCLESVKLAQGDAFSFGLNALQLFQKIWSATLLFLFLLAVRNTFRIR